MSLMNNGKTMEILAPAGNMESFKSACYAGADAVYVGLNKFSARANADNFDFAELEQVTAQSRLFGMKVYLALNTLVYDNELDELHEYIKNAAASGVNAFIVQDLGVAALVKEIVPYMPLHASTQMTVTTVEGAKMLKSMGFERVVLARELNREEVRRITQEAGVETEVFVHGAHCVSVSGQCYMSSFFSGKSAFFGGRSGNRGNCAQPCRLDFRGGEQDYILSLKDLSLIGHIEELREIGVKSLKIEGRMKRPEYVAAAVDACRTAFAGKSPDMDLLRNVFSRSGFTDGYFLSDYSDMQGTRTKEDVLAANKALEQIRGRFKNPVKRYEIDFFVRIRANEPMYCSISLSDIRISVAGNVPEAAETRGITDDFVKTQMLKLGGTIFTVKNIKCEIESWLFVSVKNMNELRRAAIESITKELQKCR
jgi:putative protease